MASGPFCNAQEAFDGHQVGTGDRIADLVGGFAVHVIPSDEDNDTHKFDRPRRVGFRGDAQRRFDGHQEGTRDREWQDRSADTVGELRIQVVLGHNQGHGLTFDRQSAWRVGFRVDVQQRFDGHREEAGDGRDVGYEDQFAYFVGDFKIRIIVGREYGSVAFRRSL